MQATQTVHPSSIKLPIQLKKDIEALALRDNITPHAYMLNALLEKTQHQRLRDQFVQDAQQAENDTLAAGSAYHFDDVRAYLLARQAVKNTPRPALKPLNPVRSV
jgi:predicted transcriptional regulator